jgi:hypothetical protein
MLVKERGVGTCEQVLNVSIACRRYGLSKPSSLLSTEAWLKPTTSLVESGRETEWGPTDLFKYVSDSGKVAMHWPHEIRMVEFPLHGVH